MKAYKKTIVLLLVLVASNAILAQKNKNQEAFKNIKYRNIFKEHVTAIKRKYNIHGELKWNKISPSYFELYKEIIDYFFQTEQLRFRVIPLLTKTNSLVGSPVSSQETFNILGSNM